MQIKLKFYQFFGKQCVFHMTQRPYTPYVINIHKLFYPFQFNLLLFTIEYLMKFYDTVYDRFNLIVIPLYDACFFSIKYKNIVKLNNCTCFYISFYFAYTGADLTYSPCVLALVTHRQSIQVGHIHYFLNNFFPFQREVKHISGELVNIIVPFTFFM